ncbi:MAG: shikimate kinase [Gemmatimonadota bacterium]|nr:shikimate kinase [Gemmatimonadota bacterium]
MFGNSGSGKTTRARALADEHDLVHLDLDSIVWEPDRVAVQRPLADVLASLRDFLGAHDRWVIEGCYGELVEAAAPECTRLVFLNPGVEVCQANNRRRPWEPEKYASPEEQDRYLDALQEWVADYYHRDGSWSYAAHRAIFDAYPGDKIEVGASEG